MYTQKNSENLIFAFVKRFVMNFQPFDSWGGVCRTPPLIFIIFAKTTATRKMARMYICIIICLIICKKMKYFIGWVIGSETRPPLWKSQTFYKILLFFQVNKYLGVFVNYFITFHNIYIIRIWNPQNWKRQILNYFCWQTLFKKTKTEFIYI